MLQQSSDKKNLLIYILLLITVTAVGVTVWALFFRTPEKQLLAPDYAPVATEQYARPIPNDHGVQPEVEPGTGSINMAYSNEVEIDLGGGKVELFFANPGNSNQDMVLQIVIRDTVILQSGRITPGNQVTRLELTADAAEILSPGGYEGSFLIFYYDLTSGEKAIVNTEVPITVTVRE